MKKAKAAAPPRSTEIAAIAAGPDARHELGRRGEDLAARFLASRGFAVIERNWRPGAAGAASDAAGDVLGARIRLRGELDAIAWEGTPGAGGVLCFVEVKTRASSEWGTPGQAVNASKQRQIVRLAQAFLALRGPGDRDVERAPCRFDVVEVWMGEGQTPRVALHRAAFDASSEASSRRDF
jgi:putative endonuclease